MAGEFDILILSDLAPLVEFTLEDYIRSDSVLSYPEDFVRGDALLQKRVDIYVRGAPALQAVFENLIHADALVQRPVHIYVRGDVNFGLQELERFVKGNALLLGRDFNFIRGDVLFNYSADFIRGLATLVRAPNLEDVGDDPPTDTTPGVMSRHYLSVVSVKKEVS